MIKYTLSTIIYIGIPALEEVFQKYFFRWMKIYILGKIWCFPF